MANLDDIFSAERVGAELHIAPRGLGPTIIRWIDLKNAFGGDGAVIERVLSASETRDFGAPGAVPGSVDLTIPMPGAAFNDGVIVAAPVTIGANYLLTGFVSSPDLVTVRWTQIAGVPADPDGAGGTYRVYVVKV